MINIPIVIIIVTDNTAFDGPWPPSIIKNHDNPIVIISIISTKALDGPFPLSLAIIIIIHGTTALDVPWPKSSSSLALHILMCPGSRNSHHYLRIKIFLWVLASTIVVIIRIIGTTALEVPWPPSIVNILITFTALQCTLFSLKSQHHHHWHYIPWWALNSLNTHHHRHWHYSPWWAWPLSITIPNLRHFSLICTLQLSILSLPSFCILKIRPAFLVLRS